MSKSRKSVRLHARPGILQRMSYQFPESDSLGLAIKPTIAHKVGIGCRAVDDFARPDESAPRLGQSASRLERDFFVILEFSPHVVAWHPQPMWLRVPPRPGRRAHRYTPSVAIEYSDGTTELCDVRERHELKEKWPVLHDGFRAAVKFCKAERWRFRLYTDTTLRTPFLTNARFLLGYRERGTDDVDILRVKVQMDVQGGSACPAELLTGLGRNAGQRERYLSVIWHMLAKGQLFADLSVPLTMHTTLRLNPERPTEGERWATRSASAPPPRCP